jgi:hypothetical protein
MNKRDFWRYVLVIRKRNADTEWLVRNHYETRDAAMSAADSHASCHLDDEAGVLELTTIMHAEIVTRVEKL